MTQSESFVETHSIGLRTRICALAHVLPGAIIGEDCSVGDHTLIENNVVVGNRVVVGCGVALWDGITVEDDVYIGAHVAFARDPSTANDGIQAEPAKTIIRRRAVLGTNATVYAGITIGERANILAGSVVTRNVPPLAIVSGNPAVIVGYEGTRLEHTGPIPSAPPEPSVRTTKVAGVTLHRMPSAADMRGLLSYGETGKQVPFEVKRFFIVYGVASQETRGEHAHRKLHQFLICVHGRCNLMADDGENRQEFLLDNPTVGVHLPPLVWAVQYKHTADAVLLVLASDYYDSADYIRDYSEYQQILHSRHRA